MVSVNLYNVRIYQNRTLNSKACSRKVQVLREIVNNYGRELDAMWKIDRYVPYRTTYGFTLRRIESLLFREGSFENEKVLICLQQELKIESEGIFFT